jgi:predicted permease
VAQNSSFDWVSFVRGHLRLEGIRPERESEIVEDLARQLDDAYRESLSRGMPDEQAIAHAKRQIANWTMLGRAISRLEAQKMSSVTQWQNRAEDRDLRKRGAFGWLTDLRQDVIYGLRLLRKSPGFTAIAVLTLALGIGANTAIFSLIDTVMLKSLPVRDPATLMLLQFSARKSPNNFSTNTYGDCVANYTDTNASGCSLSKPFLDDVRSNTSVFSGLAEWASAGRPNLSGNGPASLVNAQYVSGDYFETLGVNAAVGRVIQPSDDTPSSNAVVVLRYGYWKTAFGGDPSAVGRTIHVNNLPFTIAGVAEQSYVGLTPGNVYDIWVPLAQRPHLNKYWNPHSDDAGAWWLVAVGRLKPGVKREAAQGVLSTLFFNDLVHGEKPLSKAEDAPAINLVPAQTGLTGARRRFSTTLYILMSAVGVVLLVACANVAGLMLARAASRQKEVAVRLALGAGRARIVRQLLTESVTLAIAGGLLGIAIAYWSAHALLAFLGSNSSRPLGLSADLDARVLGFTFGVSLLTGIFFGIAPALRSMRVDLTPALKEGAGKGSGTGSGRRWFSAGNSLVVAQVALTVVVLVGAGLLVHTLANLRSIDPGFSSENVLTFGVNSTLTGYQGVRLAELYNDLRDRFAAIPGVISAGYSQTPLLAGSMSATSFHAPGGDPMKSADSDVLDIGPDFFETMRIGVISGRQFTEAEYETAAQDNRPGAFATTVRPAIVNEAFVKAYFPNTNPLDKTFGQDSDEMSAKYSQDFPNYHRNPGWFVVGVVKDARYYDLREAVKPTMYLPSGNGGYFELRTATNPLALMPEIQRVVQQAGSDMPIYDVKTQTQQIDDLLFQERLVARLGSLFAGLALLLACIGLYGLLSYEVTRRTQEIGIRMALGAQSRDVLRSVIFRGIVLAAVGAAIGIGASFGITRYLTSILYDVKAGDPITLAIATALLLFVALAACFVPARRATRVDPLVALRYE